ncbi:DUF4421 family protein [Cognatitamlana onchidii]|uniref:DUF4421 family protein n=1 Tax=Cognatitamlana onchidii TaxID=2562860 RepID=UPI0010A5C4FF|nr:DUF4421 family protein [Algibacter onchidii]
MGIKQIFLASFLFCFVHLCSAQDSIQTVSYETLNGHTKKFLNRITGRLFYVNTSNALQLNDRNSDLFFKLTPNKQDRIGASIAFRSIQISYAFAPNFLSNNKDNTGSRLFNLNFRNYFGKHWMQTIMLYNEKGFYLSNNEFNTYYPNIKSFKIGGGTSYIINENFSFKAIVGQNEKQLKSAGSFIPRFVYFYSEFNFNFDDPNSASNLYSFDIAFAPSYYYNFVPSKNLLISAGASAGIGINFSNSTTQSLTSLLTELNFRGSLTYDIENLYLGTHYSYLVLNHNTDRQTYVKDNIPYFEIFVGYRFKAPRKLIYKADIIDDKLGL